MSIYRTIKKKQNLQNILKKCLHWTNIAFQSFANPPRLTVIGNIRILFSDHFPGPLACTPTDLVSKKKPTFPPRCNFRCSVHLLHFCDPLLTLVSKATCGQAGDSKSSENWSTRGCPKIRFFRLVLELKQKYVLPSIHLRLIFINWKSTDFNNLTIYSTWQMYEIWKQVSFCFYFCTPYFVQHFGISCLCFDSDLMKEILLKVVVSD